MSGLLLSRALIATPCAGPVIKGASGRAARRCLRRTRIDALPAWISGRSTAVGAHGISTGRPHMPRFGPALPGRHLLQAGRVHELRPSGCFSTRDLRARACREQGGRERSRQKSVSHRNLWALVEGQIGPPLQQNARPDAIFRARQPQSCARVRASLLHHNARSALANACTDERRNGRLRIGAARGWLQPHSARGRMKQGQDLGCAAAQLRTR